MLSISYCDLLNSRDFDDIGITLKMEAPKDRSSIRVVQRDVDADAIVSVTIHKSYKSAWQEWDSICEANTI